LDLSKKNRAVLAVCVIVALLVALINDQVSSLQRKGIAATLPRPFNGVESSRQGHPTTVFSQMLLNAVLGYLEYF